MPLPAYARDMRCNSQQAAADDALAVPAAVNQFLADDP
jgi:hypothetical protein